MPRLGCIGDTHIGAWTRYSDDRLGEQEQAIRDALAIFKAEGCDGVLFAGDATHEPRPAPEHYLAWLRPFRDSGLPVLGISGNSHDTRTAELPIPLDVIAGGNIRLSRVPEVIDFCGVQVATMPWTPVARLVAANGGGDRDDINTRAAELLLTAARGLRSSIDTDRPSVLLGHWHIDAALNEHGDAIVEFAREPILPAYDLDALDFDAVVFGHNHRGQLLSVGLRSLMLHTGSPLPLNFGEAGYDHGCWILDLPGFVNEAAFHPIESRRFVTLDVALDPAFDAVTSRDFLFAETTRPEVAGAIVKLRYSCTSEQARAVDAKWLQTEMLAAGAHRAYTEPDILRVTRGRVEGLDDEIDDSRALEMWLDNSAVAEEIALQLRDRHTSYAETVIA